MTDTDIKIPPAGWTEVSPKIVAVWTLLAAAAPRVKWTAALVGHFIGSLERAGYVITEKQETRE